MTPHVSVKEFNKILDNKNGYYKKTIKRPKLNKQPRKQYYSNKIIQNPKEFTNKLKIYLKQELSNIDNTNSRIVRNKRKYNLYRLINSLDQSLMYNFQITNNLSYDVSLLINKLVNDTWLTPNNYQIINKNLKDYVNRK